MNDPSNRLLSFSIVVPTRNRSKKLKQKVLHLLRTDYPEKLFEIIVIDNDSQDDTLTVLKELQKKDKRIRFYTESRLGPSYARNLGIKEAKFKHIVFSDDDILLPKNILKLYNKAWLLHPHAAVIGSKIRAVSEVGKNSQKEQKMIDAHPWCYGQLNYGEEELSLNQNECVFSGNMSIKNVGINFETSLGQAITPQYRIGAEDFELCKRQVLSGKEVWYVPQIEVINTIRKDRFNGRYLSHRYYFAGIEVQFMDELLLKQFPETYESYAFQLKRSLKSVLRNGNLNFFKYFLKSKYDLVLILSYFLNKKFMGLYREY